MQIRILPLMVMSTLMTVVKTRLNHKPAGNDSLIKASVRAQTEQIIIKFPYFISDAEGIFPSNIWLAALAAAFPGPIVATARTRSPLTKKSTADQHVAFKLFKEHCPEFFLRWFALSFQEKENKRVTKTAVGKSSVFFLSYYSTGQSKFCLIIYIHREYVMKSARTDLIHERARLCERVSEFYYTKQRARVNENCTKHVPWRILFLSTESIR